MRSDRSWGIWLSLCGLVCAAIARSDAAWIAPSLGAGHVRTNEVRMMVTKGPKVTPPATKPTSPTTASKPGTLETLLQVYTQDPIGGKKESRPDRKYTLITGLPLKPYFERKTVRYQVSPDIWAFEQPQGFFNVSTSVRMTVVRLKSGDLWVHDPVAPTAECLRLVNELGPVKHIVLATTGLEHKVFVKDFSNAYPKAKVYAAPGQWSWPINLPPPFRVDGGYLREDETGLPWADEIQHALFRPPVIGIGPANEAVFFHKTSKTLIVTDLCVFIKAKEPVAVVDVPDLLAAARDDDTEPIPADSVAARNRGWARMALQILFLGPTNFSTFKLVSDRLLVSPVIQTFVLSKIPGTVAEFINTVTSRWAFTSIIPAHFNAPAPATPLALQQAFAFAYEQSGVKPAKPAAASQPFWQALTGGGVSKSVTYPASDMATLDAVNSFIVKAGVANK